MFGIHHFRHALQGRDDHSLFPFVQDIESRREILLQRDGRLHKDASRLKCETRMDFAFVNCGSLA